MGRRFALVWTKGDWAEFAITCAFPTWSSNLFPCFGCFVERESLAEVEEGWLDEGMPRQAVTDEVYDAACRACEVRVSVADRAEHAALRAALFFDRRQQGSRGRALAYDLVVGCVQLFAGERLEPGAELPDTFSFDGLRFFS